MTLDVMVSHVYHRLCAVDMVCVEVSITARVRLDGTEHDVRCRSATARLGLVHATTHTVRVLDRTSVIVSVETTTGLNARFHCVEESS